MGYPYSPLTPSEYFPVTSDELIHHLDTICQGYKGNAEVLESAIGAYIVGRTYGWKVMYLVHNKATIAKYEDILKRDFRDDLPPDTDHSKKSLAFRALKGITNFWKAVKGEYPGVRSTQIK